MDTLKSVMLLATFFSFNPVVVLAVPDPTPDPAASVIYLRTSCDIANSDAGESPMENCFESISAVQSWVYGGTVTSSAILIDIGPGTYSGGSYGFSCDPGTNGSDLTFRGSGTGKTVLSGSAFGIFQNQCGGTKWAFIDLTIRGGVYGVVWQGGGESTWSNTVIDRGWYDQQTSSSSPPCKVGDQGMHRFFSSRIIAYNSFGHVFGSRCGDNWFWGSELVFTNYSSGSNAAVAIEVDGVGNQLHLYGSNIITEINPGTTPASLTAIRAVNGGVVHVHGTGIDVIGEGSTDIVALEVASGGHIHANESSYVLETSGNGTVSRVVNNGGFVSAPFLWGAVTSPPAIVSVDGADTAVITSGTADNHPHMVIYDSSCASSWYDMVDAKCLQ